MNSTLIYCEVMSITEIKNVIVKLNIFNNSSNVATIVTADTEPILSESNKVGTSKGSLLLSDHILAMKFAEAS